LKAGIISRSDDEGKYYLNKELRIGILKLFIRIGNRVIPLISLYLIIYILGFIVYAILALIHGNKFIKDPVSLILLFFLIFGALLFIFESFKIQKLKPTR
jgi:cellulose synthase/poly-beta-1,6-N-acetylglucosamine synthase-like glycosyltransferase